MKYPALLEEEIEFEKSLKRTLIYSERSEYEDTDGILLDETGWRLYFTDRFGGLHCYDYRFVGEKHVKTKSFYVPKTVLRRMTRANVI